MKHDLILAIIGSIAGVCSLVLAFLFILIKKHRRLLLQQQALADVELQYQKDLLNAVINSQEQERRRIGNDLHDQVGVALSALQMIIEKQTGLSAPPSLFLRSKEIISNIIGDLRRISHNLSPDINTGNDINEALAELVSSLNLSGNIQVVLKIGDHNNMHTIRQEKAIAIYRVIAELIHNGLRHSKGSKIEVAMSSIHAELALQYSDDGIGIDASGLAKKKGIGFRNIESRLAMMNARWLDENVAGKGFRCRILIPVEN